MATGLEAEYTIPWPMSVRPSVISSSSCPSPGRSRVRGARVSSVGAAAPSLVCSATYRDSTPTAGPLPRAAQAPSVPDDGAAGCGERPEAVAALLVARELVERGARR